MTAIHQAKFRKFLFTFSKWETVKEKFLKYVFSLLIILSFMSGLIDETVRNVEYFSGTQQKLCHTRSKNKVASTLQKRTIDSEYRKINNT
jgi:hypothetical protein